MLGGEKGLFIKMICLFKFKVRHFKGSPPKSSLYHFTGPVTPTH